MSYSNDSPTEFLQKAGQDFLFWTRILRDSETLSSKMVALSGVQNNLQFVSTLMRDRVVADNDLDVVEGWLRPFTEDESDIGEAFVVGEARIAVLSDPHPLTFRSSWASRLLLQENATLNEEFSTVLAPMRLRASLTAREFYRQEAYEALPYSLALFPPPLFNLGGKLARRSAWGDAPVFVARVHDQNGRISLVSLQAEIERDFETAIEAVVRSSKYRNPYTDEPMKYDAQAHTIAFECLHAVFHQPASPDACSIAIGPRAY